MPFFSMYFWHLKNEAKNQFAQCARVRNNAQLYAQTVLFIEHIVTN